MSELNYIVQAFYHSCEFYVIFGAGMSFVLSYFVDMRLSSVGSRLGSRDHEVRCSGWLVADHCSWKFV